MDSIVSLTVAIDVPLHRQLCKLATASGRSTSWLIDQALRRYIAAEMAAIEAASAEAEAVDDTEAVPHDKARDRTPAPRRRRPTR
jgi:predicted transcriptional regulator